jgi:hypothetical protein
MDESVGSTSSARIWWAGGNPVVSSRQVLASVVGLDALSTEPVHDPRIHRIDREREDVIGELLNIARTSCHDRRAIDPIVCSDQQWRPGDEQDRMRLVKRRQASPTAAQVAPSSVLLKNPWLVVRTRGPPPPSTAIE